MQSPNYILSDIPLNIYLALDQFSYDPSAH